ncbi:MAG TPA: phosphopantetheine-binding protein [Actinophytocola sp.]|uniref:phosphopantetheine-binding protein n=1 Tax=Actinophytocola sp. TaxID=1872138 RepID=UPI002DDCD268|nr:phosphopantetheine-binding protein [Actinophytocola sp.]HEV2782252.1 phosphopantetheine-binding protein [Actinophytocola sp.]
MDEPAVTKAGLLREVARIVGRPPEEIPDRGDLMRLGVSSLALMRLVNTWRVRGLPVAYADLAAEPTIDSWWRQLHRLQQANPYWRAAS